MSDMATVLKQEISRLARRELRAEIEPLRKIVANQRREMAALKRANLQLAASMRSLAKSATTPSAAKEPPEDRPIRFVAKGLRSLRARLGLSSKDLATLLGVSEQSIYNWEQKKTVPRREQVVAIAGLRGLGKREVRARLSSKAS